MPRSSARRHCRRHTCPPPRPGSFIHGDGLPPLPYPYRRCHHPPCLFCLVRHYYLYQQDAASLVRANNKEEERRKRAMSVPGAVAADAVAAECYFCGGAAAVVYCRADAAALCLACDRQVHAANTVSCRHARAPLCAACRSAAATVRRGAARFFCSNCDFEKQQQEEERGEPTQPPPPLHDGGAVESYTGCPSACELAAFLGVAGGDKAAEAWWPAWEEPQVLTFDDVLVETTSCHGLRPLLTTSSPKSRSPAGGELDGEVLRQLGELAKSEEAAAYVEEIEPAGVDQLPPWESSDYDIGHGDLGALGAETIACVTASLHIPSCQHHEARISADCNAGAQQEQVSASSSAEPSQTSFVELSEVCPGLSRSGSSADDVPNHDHPSPAPVAAPAQPAQATKNVGGYDVVYPDRDRVISRYKEKRKNRIFGKQIRYESRKARADGRVRINGRFAKTS